MFAPHESENCRKPFNRAEFGRFGKQKIAVKNVPDHRFDHLHDHNKINYRGIAQLVARDIWEHRRCSHCMTTTTAESPSTVRILGGLANEKRQSKLCLTTDLTTYTTTI